VTKASNQIQLKVMYPQNFSGGVCHSLYTDSAQNLDTTFCFLLVHDARLPPAETY